MQEKRDKKAMLEDSDGKHRVVKAQDRLTHWTAEKVRRGDQREPDAAKEPAEFGATPDAEKQKDKDENVDAKDQDEPEGMDVMMEEEEIMEEDLTDGPAR